MNKNDRQYIVITPAFNEENNIPKTINSMIHQLRKPLIWVIVDDGSKDNTYNICLDAARQHEWIHCLINEKSVDQNADGLISASEAKAFLKGYQYALTLCYDVDYVVKLDSDLEFGEEYFMTLLEEFSKNEKLGLAGGVVYEYKNGKLSKDRVNPAHVRGATKMYRKSCYDAIGGVLPVFGWDAVDEILAREKGWQVKSFDDLHLIHLRRTASRVGRFKGWARNGYMAYYIGMSPWRMIARSIFRLVVALDPVQSAGLFWGYFSNWLGRKQKLPIEAVLRSVESNQWYSAKKLI